MRNAIIYLCIVKFCCALMVLAAGCKPQTTPTSSIFDVATTSSVKTGFFTPLARKTFALDPKVRLESVAELARRLGHEGASRDSAAYGTAVTADGEQILLQKIGEDRVPLFSLDAEGQVFQWYVKWKDAGKSNVRLYLKAKRGETPAPSVSADGNASNLWIPYHPKTTTGSKEPILVNWTKLLLASDGSLNYKVGNTAVNAATGRPSFEFQEVEKGFWILAGSYKDADIQHGSVFWSPGAGAFYSYTSGAKTLTVWKVQDDDSMDRVGRRNLSGFDSEEVKSRVLRLAKEAATRPVADAVSPIAIDRNHIYLKPWPGLLSGAKVTNATSAGRSSLFLAEQQIDLSRIASTPYGALPVLGYESRTQNGQPQYGFSSTDRSNPIGSTGSFFRMNDSTATQRSTSGGPEWVGFVVGAETSFDRKFETAPAGWFSDATYEQRNVRQLTIGRIRTTEAGQTVPGPDGRPQVEFGTLNGLGQFERIEDQNELARLQGRLQFEQQEAVRASEAAIADARQDASAQIRAGDVYADGVATRGERLQKILGDTADPYVSRGVEKFARGDEAIENVTNWVVAQGRTTAETMYDAGRGDTPDATAIIQDQAANARGFLPGSDNPLMSVGSDLLIAGGGYAAEGRMPSGWEATAEVGTSALGEIGSTTREATAKIPGPAGVVVTAGTSALETNARVMAANASYEASRANSEFAYAESSMSQGFGNQASQLGAAQSTMNAQGGMEQIRQDTQAAFQNYGSPSQPVVPAPAAPVATQNPTPLAPAEL